MDYLEIILQDIVSGIVSGIVIAIILSLYNNRNLKIIKEREKENLRRKLLNNLNLREVQLYLSGIDEILRGCEKDTTIYFGNSVIKQKIFIGDNVIYSKIIGLYEFINQCRLRKMIDIDVFKSIVKEEMRSISNKLEDNDIKINDICYKYDFMKELKNYDLINDFFNNSFFWSERVETISDNEDYVKELEKGYDFNKYYYDLSEDEVDKQYKEKKNEIIFNFPSNWIRSEFINREFHKRNKR